MITDLPGVLNACADETRLRLMRLLAGATEICVSDMVDVMGTNQPKISRHLAYLRRAQLVRERKHGLHVYYRLATLEECPARSIVDAILAWLGRVETRTVEREPSERELSIELL
jgi:ArsR family transcriptional regulator, arsenate/arsenite/antimonite-responsive transcriptional repressor